MSRFRIAVCAGTVLLALSLSNTSFAKRVVVRGFIGPKSGIAEREVMKVVRRQHKLVATRTYGRTARRMRALAPTNRNIARVAKKLNLDAVITGRIKGRGGKKRVLRLVVREGRTGKAVRTVVIPLRARFDARSRRMLAKRLLAALRKARGPARKQRVARRKPRPDPEPEESFDDDDDDSDDGEVEAASEDASKDGDDDTDEDEGDEFDDDDDSDEPSIRTPLDRMRHPGLEVNAGMSFISRNMSFDYDPAVPSRPWTYAGNPVPGIRLGVEMYPMVLLGLAEDGFLSGIGGYVVYDQVIALESRLQSGGATFNTSQQRIGFGGVVRMNLDSKATSPTFKLSAGYETLAFDIDTGAMIVELPNVTYNMFNFAATARIPIGSPKFALFAKAGYLLVGSVGDMETMANYGNSTVAGLDFDAGVHIRLLQSSRLSVRLGFHVTRFSYTFDGTGARTDRNSDAAQDVAGATDQYIGGYAQLGYLF